VLESFSGLRFPPAAVARASTPVLLLLVLLAEELACFELMTDTMSTGLSQAPRKGVNFESMVDAPYG